MNIGSLHNHLSTQLFEQLNNNKERVFEELVDNYLLDNSNNSKENLMSLCAPRQSTQNQSDPEKKFFDRSKYGRDSNEGARTPQPPGRNNNRLSTKSGLSYTYAVQMTETANGRNQSDSMVSNIFDDSVTSKSFEGTKQRRSRRERVKKKAAGSCDVKGQQSYITTTTASEPKASEHDEQPMSKQRKFGGIFSGVQTMDDFANMLLQQKQEQVSPPKEETALNVKRVEIDFYLRPQAELDDVQNDEKLSTEQESVEDLSQVRKPFSCDNSPAHQPQNVEQTPQISAEKSDSELESDQSDYFELQKIESHPTFCENEAIERNFEDKLLTKVDEMNESQENMVTSREDKEHRERYLQMYKQSSNHQSLEDLNVEPEESQNNDQSISLGQESSKSEQAVTSASQHASQSQRKTESEKQQSFEQDESQSFQKSRIVPKEQEDADDTSYFGMSIKASPINMKTQDLTICDKASSFSPNTPISHFKGQQSNIPKNNKQLQVHHSNFQDNLYRTHDENSQKSKEEQDKTYYYQGDEEKVIDDEQIRKDDSLQMEQVSLDKGGVTAINQQTSTLTLSDNTHHFTLQQDTSNINSTAPADKQMLVIISQYEMVLAQLNQQVQGLMTKNHQLEQKTIQQELQIAQEQQKSSSYKQQIQSASQKEKQFEVALQQQMENHSKVVQCLNNELEGTKGALSELENTTQQMSILIKQQGEKCKTLEGQLSQRDSQIQKLRSDNQNMFSDLKQLAQTEERLKREVEGQKKKRAEVEQQSEEVYDKCQAQAVQIRQLANENDHLKRESVSQNAQVPQLIKEIEQLREEAVLYRDKSQQIESQKINLLNEKERKDREIRNLHSEISKLNSVVQNLKSQQESSGQQFGNFYGKAYSKERTPVSPIGRMNRQVLQTNDMNISDQGSMGWHRQVSPVNRGFQVPRKQDDRATSPFVTRPHSQQLPMSPFANKSSLSPLQGGKKDPNMAQYARQNNNNQQNLAMQLGSMQLQDLFSHKQKLESEYQRIPITVSGKSMQVRKRKEELEFELDTVEKYIYRAKQKKSLY